MYDLQSTAMSRAGEFRSQGYDKSDALSMAWDDVLGDYYDEEDEDIDLGILPQARRRSSNPGKSDIDIGTVLLFVAFGYFGWCAIRFFQTKSWSWKPWEKVPVSRRLTTPVTSQTAVRPGATVIGQSDSHKVYQAKDFTEESIYLITP